MTSWNVVVLFAPERYTKWTYAFGNGLYFEGLWLKGHRIRFLTTSGHGVISEIAENRPDERFIGHLRVESR